MQDVRHIRITRSKSLRALTVEIPSREVKKAFRIAWLNIVHHIEDEASSESDKKVEWYSDRHDKIGRAHV